MDINCASAHASNIPYLMRQDLHFMIPQKAQSCLLFENMMRLSYPKREVLFLVPKTTASSLLGIHTFALTEEQNFCVSMAAMVSEQTIRERF